MFDSLRRQNRKLQASVDEPFHLRAPFWWLRLPNGDEVKVASFSYEGTLCGPKSTDPRRTPDANASE
jgi:hypothetical protein